jgi:hypothetical protein
MQKVQIRTDYRKLWAIEVEKRLIERDMTKRKLAAEINENYTRIVNVMRGSERMPSDMRIRDKILDYFGLEA